MSEKKEKLPQDIVQSAFQNGNIPVLYINSFISGVGLGDAYLILQTNGETTAIVNMSLPTLKTLAHNLMATIQGIEEKLEQETLTLQELQERLTKE
jgi:prefoldin subunit 5